VRGQGKRGRGREDRGVGAVGGCCVGGGERAVHGEDGAGGGAGWGFGDGGAEVLGLWDWGEGGETGREEACCFGSRRDVGSFLGGFGGGGGAARRGELLWSAGVRTVMVDDGTATRREWSPFFLGVRGQCTPRPEDGRAGSVPRSE